MGYRKQLSGVMLLHIIIIIFLSQLSVSLPHLCTKHESTALLNFKRSLSIDPLKVDWCEYFRDQQSYPKTNLWNASRDCCLWDGVICDEFTGHVIELDLGCSRLVGKIDSNSSLFQLSHLQRLNLSLNDFHRSHISPKFGRFSSLTHLDLSYASFSGQVPSEISHIFKLLSLHLGTTIYRYKESDHLRLAAQDFKLVLQNLTQLQELSLSGVSITSTVPPNISSYLTTLSLAYTGLYGILPDGIFHLPNLELLSLSGNSQLSGYFPKTKWNSSASLSFLDLSEVMFSAIFPESLSYLTSLHFLALDNCDLCGLISSSLSNLTLIEHLFLQNNSLNGTIPSWIFSTPSLKSVYLRDNRFSGQVEDFKFNSSLVSFDLGVNQLQGHIPKTIQNLVSLEYLDLSSNNFSGDTDVSLFSNIMYLEFLDLSHNCISLTNDKGKLPKSLMYLRLSGCEVKELDFLRSAKNLQNLDLSNNKIQGSIPDWAWSNWMFSLTYLNISNNMLTSIPSIPLHVVNTIDLQHNSLQGSLSIPSNYTEYFLISNNNLTGEIPLSICKLTSLKVLAFARNNFVGTIPQCLGNISSLEVLDMHRNNLSGTLPTTFSIESSIRSFNLHGNKLEGKIPPSLTHCENLQVLDLGNNHLNDSFPMWLGTLPELQVLSLRSNKLQGSIRSSRFGRIFPKLRILDLSYNAFSGNLPTSLFQHLKAMSTIEETKEEPRYLGDTYYYDSIIVAAKGLEQELVRILTVYTTIDISSNKFEGPIPSIMGDLIALRVLNLSHNRLKGQIPPSLGRLSEVESLDLSFNHLAGEIPVQLASLTFLAFVNLSYNHLEGCIPQGTQFSTFPNSSFEGNNGLRGFPISKGCGGDRVAEENHTVFAPYDQESDSQFCSGFWKAALMGYASAFCIGLSIIYFMVSSGYPKWIARFIVELEHKISMQQRKKHRGQRKT